MAQPDLDFECIGHWSSSDNLTVQCQVAETWKAETGQTCHIAVAAGLELHCGHSFARYYTLPSLCARECRKAKFLSQRDVQKLQKSIQSHRTELSIWLKIHEILCGSIEALLHDAVCLIVTSDFVIFELFELFEVK